jgi:site-specific DNA recombinase
MARARIYIRRSDDDQSAWSPEAQEREARRWCADNGHEVVGVYIDDDFSGRREERPEFQRLLTEAKADPGSLVVVHKFDRVGRDAEVILRTYKELKRRRVKLISVSERFDPDEPIGAFMLSVSAGAAQYHSDNLATEVRKGLREKWEQGGWLGLLPYGYISRFDYDTKGERIRGSGRAVFSADADSARLIFELYSSSNYSDLKLAEEMNRRGFLMLHKGARVAFQKDSIQSILTNPFYIGVVRYQGEERPGVHEPLISRDLWNQVQNIRARRAKRPGKAIIHGPGGLLSELAYCGKCGARLWWNAGRYLCGRRRRFGVAACDASMILATKIEPIVLDVLRNLSLIAPLRDAVIAVVQERLERPTTGGDIDAAALHAQIARLKEMYEWGDLDKAAYLRKREQLQRQLTRAHEHAPRVLDLERATLLLSNITELLDVANDAQRRGLIQSVFETLWLEKGAVTAIRPAPAYTLLIEAIAGCVWRPRLGSNQQPSAPEADALSD